MSSRDVRDMLDLPSSADGGVGKPGPAKKAKLVDKRPEGINRELYALLGERAPPVAMIQEQSQYKQRPKRPYRAARWVRTPFLNPARRDELTLRHWRRQQEARPMGDAENTALPVQEVQRETEYVFAKYDTPSSVPQYDDAVYESYLRSMDWTREETDYLLELVKEYHERWPVVWDRYEYVPSSDSNGVDETTAAATPATRSMEALKARYYTVCATMMAQKTPPATMTAAEFQAYEILKNWSPEQEITRKALAAKLLSRTADEVREEEWLLTELQRIVASQKRFDAERAELRARLEPAPRSRSAQLTNLVGVARNTPVAGFTVEKEEDAFRSSAALTALLQNLLQADKNKKRRSLIGAEGTLTSPSMANGPPTAGSVASHRDSLASAGLHTPATATSKKGGGLLGAATAGNRDQHVRDLSAADAARFLVTTHERLTSGVTFRSDKLLKLRQAKSQQQTQRIAEALATLDVPEVVTLCTPAVCEAFEKLVAQLNTLLDARRVGEKMDAELKVAREKRKERLLREGHAPDEEGGEKGEKAGDDGKTSTETAADKPTANGAGTDGAQDDADADGDADADADAEGEAETAASTNDKDKDDTKDADGDQTMADASINSIEGDTEGDKADGEHGSGETQAGDNEAEHATTNGEAEDADAHNEADAEAEPDADGDTHEEHDEAEHEHEAEAEAEAEGEGEGNEDEPSTPRKGLRAPKTAAGASSAHHRRSVSVLSGTSRASRASSRRTRAHGPA